MEAGMNKILDYGERLFLVALTSFFLKALFLQAAQHPIFLRPAVSESLPVILILIRKPGAISTSPFAFLVAFLGTAAPLLLRPHTGADPLASTVYLGALMTLGLCVNVASKLALWRSFGLTAANRGVRQGGPYRYVRHPMYLGYFLTQFGFLFANPNLANLAICLVAWTAQLLRIREEEQFLMQDEAYRALAARVQFRLLPGIY